MRHDALASMPCAIARGMAVLGERWTFVILRSASMGARRFEDHRSSTGIARTILANRLETLVDHGILERRPYAEHAGRTLHEHRLTQKGMDRHPVLVSLMEWGNRFGGFDDEPPVELEHKRCAHTTTPGFVCSACGEDLRARDVTVHEMAAA